MPNKYFAVVMWLIAWPFSTDIPVEYFSLWSLEISWLSIDVNYILTHRIQFVSKESLWKQTCTLRNRPESVLSNKVPCSLRLIYWNTVNVWSDYWGCPDYLGAPSVGFQCMSYTCFNILVKLKPKRKCTKQAKFDICKIMLLYGNHISERQHRIHLTQLCCFS